MRVGVNYTPRKGWFHSWLDLDIDEVAADFEAIAGLGLDHVRVFPLWPLLQPNRGLIRPRAVADVLAVVDAAQAAGLDISVDALNGHLSSYDFLPAWVTTWHWTNLFTDEVALAGEAALVEELAAALRDHPAVTGMTLGNEFAQFAAPTLPHLHPTVSAATPSDIDAWFDRLLSPLEQAWPEGRHHHGFDDDLWFVDAHPFTPRHAVTRGAATTVHSWVFAQVGPRYGAGHPALVSFPRYLLELGRAWSPDPTRPLWLQEVGAPRTHVSDEAAAGFLNDTLDAVIDTPGLEAITWWCSHDVSRDLLDFPELEYTLGLFTTDGAPKPEARQLAERIGDLRASDTPGVASPDDAATLEFVADWESGSGRSSTSPMGPIFDEWQARFADGEVVALRRVQPEATPD
ncbi:MAG: hypothetical protein IPJ61_03880 [Tessaracoccus sp.]|uniref:glycoside hydrolase 5 family protein n=1 Tax=Tessaracoccus sp. TaxID=1971211 RepID=UPI001EB33055|nr:hypothetical protein [Tessaracoccus sp.]MBK7820220.1 hypothetical protein [Tessaracoccus sp.]